MCTGVAFYLAVAGDVSVEPKPPGEHGKPDESHDSELLGGLDVMGEDDHVSHGVLHGDGVVEAVDFLGDAFDDEPLGSDAEAPKLHCPPLEAMLAPATPDAADSPAVAADVSLCDPPAAPLSPPGPAPLPEESPNLDGDAELVKLPVLAFSEPAFFPIFWWHPNGSKLVLYQSGTIEATCGNKECHGWGMPCNTYTEATKGKPTKNEAPAGSPHVFLDAFSVELKTKNDHAKHRPSVERRANAREEFKRLAHTDCLLMAILKAERPLRDGEPEESVEFPT